jgi:hypothetical protein
MKLHQPLARAASTLAILLLAGKDHIVYRAYDADHDGRPTLGIAPLGWTNDDWPAAFV